MLLHERKWRSIEFFIARNVSSERLSNFIFCLKSIHVAVQTLSNVDKRIQLAEMVRFIVAILIKRCLAQSAAFRE